MTYAGICADLMEGKFLTIKTGHPIVGPQGVAAEVELSDREQQLLKVKNAVPHVSLMVSSDYEARDLGPMVKTAETHRMGLNIM